MDQRPLIGNHIDVPSVFYSSYLDVWLPRSCEIGPYSDIIVIVCHLHVSNLSVAPSKQWTADVVPGCSGIKCHCDGSIVRGASGAQWQESHLTSVCLIAPWHSHLICPSSTSLLLLCQKHFSFHCRSSSRFLPSLPSIINSCFMSGIEELMFAFPVSWSKVRHMSQTRTRCIQR